MGSSYEQKRRLGLPGSLSPDLRHGGGVVTEYIRISFPVPVDFRLTLERRYQADCSAGYRGDMAVWLAQVLRAGLSVRLEFPGAL